MDRRLFIEKSLAGSAIVASLPLLQCSWGKGDRPLSRRSLGRTGETLPVIGFGGILVCNLEQGIANERVAVAFDRGVNYFDVAPTYGNAQDVLGPALKPYRSRSFLACKTTERTGAGAEKEMHESLEKLMTDHFDLYQMHSLTTRKDVETAFGPGGAIEVFLKAKQEGKARFLGFSAHSEEAALTAMDLYDFDTVLFPINFAAWHKGRFGPAVVTRAKEKGMGILALKALALGRLGEGEARPYKNCWYRPVEDSATAGLSLRFTLSQGVTAAIPPGEPKFFEPALVMAQNTEPLSDEELDRLKALSGDLVPMFSKG